MVAGRIESRARSSSSPGGSSTQQPNGSPAYGGVLLFVYGIGIAIPVVVLGASAANFAARLEKNGGRVWFDRATGALLVAMGLYVVWSA